MKHRREVRYPLEIPVLLKVGAAEEETVTRDVSFDGMFLCTKMAVRPGQLVQVDMMLPPRGRRFCVSGMLVHTVERGPNPGVGLTLFGVGRGERKPWDELVGRLRRSMGDGGAYRAQLTHARVDPAARRRDDAQRAVMRVEVPTVRYLHDFYERDTAKGGVFLCTEETFSIGDRLGLVLVHPNSGDRFELSVEVERRVHQHGVAGLACRFDGLDEDRRQRLHEFVFDGLEDLFDEESVELRSSRPPMR